MINFISFCLKNYLMAFDFAKANPVEFEDVLPLLVQELRFLIRGKSKCMFI